MKLSIEQQMEINVELYQTIGNYIRELKYDSALITFHPTGYDAAYAFSNYDYVVCDECHYFLVDSNFNTNTGISYRFIQDFYFDKIRIFLSATIENIMH